MSDQEKRKGFGQRQVEDNERRYGKEIRARLRDMETMPSSVPTRRYGA